MRTQKNNNPLDEALKKCKSIFIITFMFSFGVNLLMLITTLYSLQVLDKVISSHSMETLFMLTLVMLVIYIAYTLLQIARSFTLIKMGEWLDRKLTPILFRNTVSLASIRPSLGSGQNLSDLETVKGFVSSTGINTLFDAPWSIVYLIVIFLIHPYLGYLTLGGGFVIFLFALLNAYATTSNLNQANEFNMKSRNLLEIATRNAESIEAMGMMNSVVKNWHSANIDKLNMQSVASYRNGIISNISRLLRSVLQMAVTAIGAYVVVKHPSEMTVGGMIASSIMVGRALAPFDAAIETWKHITGANKAYQRLQAGFNMVIRQEAMSLPTPDGNLVVENLFFAPPSTTPQASAKYTVKGLSFALDAGEILAIIGPSAAGKSSLAKLMVGVWKPLSGVVRLDGADVYSWNREDFGKHVGYLPQGVELFSGTVKDNIARLRENANPEDIVDAAKLAGVHDMILRLPNGYETDIGISGSALSAGQRQRVGLARAYFGNPKLVILDEPNANLDELGEQALVAALVEAKRRKITSIIISHRPSILSCVDKIMILQDGMIGAFGPRNEVLAKFSAPKPESQNKLN